MVRAQGDLHRLDNFEATLFFRSRHELGLCRPDGEDTRLRGVDDGSEVVDAEHAQVRDGECSALESLSTVRIPKNNPHLVFLRLQLAVACFLGQSLGLRRDACQSLRASVLNDRSNQTSRGGDGDANVGLLVSELEMR